MNGCLTLLRAGCSTSPEVDLRLAKARLAFSKSQLLRNGNALEVAKAELEQLIGQAVHQGGRADKSRFDKFKPKPG